MNLNDFIAKPGTRYQHWEVNKEEWDDLRSDNSKEIEVDFFYDITLRASFPYF